MVCMLHLKDVGSLDILPTIFATKFAAHQTYGGSLKELLVVGFARGARVLNMLPPIVSSHGLTSAIQCFVLMLWSA